MADEDFLEQMLISGRERSESVVAAKHGSPRQPAAKSSTASVQKAWSSKLGRNVKCAVNAFRHVLALDHLTKLSSKEQCRKAMWSGVLKSLTQRYPGSQLPEKLISTLRRHFDSLPLSYAQSGFDVEQVFHHVRLLEQVGRDGHCHPAVVVQDYACETGRSSSASDVSTSSSYCTSIFSEDDDSSAPEYFRIAFACKANISRPAVTRALESASVNVKQLYLFEKKGITLGVAIVQCRREFCEQNAVQAIIIAAMRRSKVSKLRLGLFGQECRGAMVPALVANADWMAGKSVAVEQDVSSERDNSLDFSFDQSLCRLVDFPSPRSLHQIITDDQQTIVYGRAVVERYLVSGDEVQMRELIAVGSTGAVYKGTYKGETVAVRKRRGCEGGGVIDVELRKDVLSLFSCEHRNILPLRGLCIDPVHGMRILMKYMEGGSLFELIQRTKKIDVSDAIRIAKDIAEGMLFLHERGIVHRDLKSSSILLDRHMRAVIGDLGVVNHEMDADGQCELGDYRWMAPEVLGSKPESTVVTFMSNVYSFGIILWEMLTCQVPYLGYSPVQAAVGIAAYGLRPPIPSYCPPLLKNLLERCWASYPLDRPQFLEVLEVLQGTAFQLPL